MKNQILRSLSPRELRALLPHLQEIHLEKDAVLYDAGARLAHVYFPAGSVVSYLAGTEDGQTLEVCLVGHEGMVGAPAVIADGAVFRGIVQVGGPAFRMRSEAFQREFKRCAGLHSVILSYTS